MSSRLRRLARAFARNRIDITVWAASAVVVVAGAVATLATSIPWFGAGAAVTAGLLRLGVEIGKRERVAGVREQLSSRAVEAVAAAAERHVLRHTIWRDEEASRIAWRAVLIERKHDFIPMIPMWSIEELVERGEERLDLRERKDGDWLAIGGELQKAHDNFAAAVGPYVADLVEDRRRYVSSCLLGLQSAKKSAEEAFRLLFKPEDATEIQIAVATHALFKDLQFVYTAARKLGAADA